MATLGVRVRSRSERFRRIPAERQFQRTRANGRARMQALAMKKVEASSSFIRSSRSPRKRGVSRLGDRTDARSGCRQSGSRQVPRSPLGPRPCCGPTRPWRDYSPRVRKHACSKQRRDLGDVGERWVRLDHVPLPNRGRRRTAAQVSAAARKGTFLACLCSGCTIAKPRIDALEGCPGRNVRLRSAPRPATHRSRTPKRPRGPSTRRANTGLSSAAAATPHRL